MGLKEAMAMVEELNTLARGGSHEMLDWEFQFYPKRVAA